MCSINGSASGPSSATMNGTRCTIRPAINSVVHGWVGWCGGAEWRRRAPPFLPLDADRAVQAEPGPPPPHTAPAAHGHELAGLRRQLTAAWEFDGVVHRGGGRRVGGRAPDDPGRAALVFGPGDPDGADRARRVPPGVPADRRPDWLHHRL